MVGYRERMLAFQPPVTRVHLRADDSGKLGWKEVWHPDGKINNAAGVTLGEVAMGVRKGFERHKDTSDKMLEGRRHGGRRMVQFRWRLTFDMDQTEAAGSSGTR